MSDGAADGDCVGAHHQSSLASDGPDETSPWSTWGVRLAAVLTVALGIVVLWAWMETFYRGVAVNTQLSYKAADMPRFMAGARIAGVRPVIGNHYFGDFQLPLAYARDLRHAISPYLNGNLRNFRPEQYPPFVQVLFVPLSFLPLPLSALIYFSLSIAVFLVPLWLLLAPMRREYRIMFLTPVAVLTTPFISLLDRGNDIGIAMGLVAWALWAWRSERWVLCGAVLAAAIALKAYPAALLVVPLALRRYKFTLLVAGSAVLANLIVLLAVPGGYLQNVWATLADLRGSSSPINQLSSWSLYSVIPKTAWLYAGGSVVNQLLAPKTWLLWLPSVLYVFGLYVVIRRGRVPQWCWGPLALATIQLVVPVSYVYSTAWAPLAAVWFAWGSPVDTGAPASHDRPAREWVGLRIMVLGVLTATLTPSVFTIAGSGGFHTPLAQYLSPMLLVLTMCTAVVYSFRSIGPVPETSPALSDLDRLDPTCPPGAGPHGADHADADHLELPDCARGVLDGDLVETAR